MAGVQIVKGWCTQANYQKMLAENANTGIIFKIHIYYGETIYFSIFNFMQRQ